ncbi:MAG: NAD(P)-dependent oxidoreductase [Clostridiales bacterium]|jgi:nucleoside-diphosphate-sugar epimerase|nr:NAD(P)-dependent oxidoreductase [Clostridiales bacterium]
MTDILMSDLSEIISDENIGWNSFTNSTILVIGATGLIGSFLVRALSKADKAFELNLNIIAIGRNTTQKEILFNELSLKFISGDIRHPEFFHKIADKIDYIFHCAAITNSTDMLERPVDVISTSVDGTKNALELAKRSSCKSFVYLSSMEIYGQTDLKSVSENDLGYVSLSNPRSSYPESKRLCEVMCLSYATQFNLPVKIARLAQTFGAGTSRDDSRVFAQFARNAINGTCIILHTDGNSRGNYCYISDSIRGLLTVLLKGKTGEAYNVSNPATSVTIREMANLLAADIFNGSVSVAVNVPNDKAVRSYAPAVGHILNIEKLKALGWLPKYSLKEMFERMIGDWNSSLDPFKNS